MFRIIGRIFSAIKCSLDEKSRQHRQFRQKQGEIYREGLTENKLRDQLMHIVAEMHNDPTIASVKIGIAKEGLPFISSIIPQLECEVIPCAVPTEFVLVPRNSFI